MQSTFVLSVLFCAASAQLAAWPASSYSPFYQALLAPARTPVISVPFRDGAIPAPVAPMVAAAPVAPMFAPMAAPDMAVPAPTVLRGPAFAYAPSPVLAQIRPPMFAAAPIAPVLAAPALPVVPRMVPAFAPFATSAMFIGSNKGRN